MKLITDLKTLDKAIASIAARGKKLDADVQQAGLSALNHVDLHGDVGPVNRLYLALGKGARRSALAAWLMAFGKVRANTEPGSKKEKPFVYAKDQVTQLEEANMPENQWFMFKPEPDPDQVFNFQNALSSLLQRAAKASNVADPARVEEVRRLVAAWGEEEAGE